MRKIILRSTELVHVRTLRCILFINTHKSKTVPANISTYLYIIDFFIDTTLILCSSDLLSNLKARNSSGVYRTLEQECKANPDGT